MYSVLKMQVYICNVNLVRVKGKCKICRLKRVFFVFSNMSCPAILLEMVSFLNMVCMHGEGFESVK